MFYFLNITRGYRPAKRKSIRKSAFLEKLAAFFGVTVLGDSALDTTKKHAKRALVTRCAKYAKREKITCAEVV